MDKRTLIFVLALTGALFLVNMYFQSQSQKDLHQWNEQLQAKKEKQMKQLESTIAQRTAKAEKLPLVQIYADAEAKDFLSDAIQNDESVLTLAWTTSLPKSVYVKKPGTDQKAEEFKLTYSISSDNSAALYQKSEKSRLQIGELPDYGQYELQLLALHPKESPPCLYYNLRRIHRWASIYTSRYIGTA